MTHLLDCLAMKLWKRTNSDQQVGGKSSAGNWPRVSTNPNGAEDARSLRLAWKTNTNANHNNNKNNNNNVSNGGGRCQEKCWAEASRRSLQHLPGLLRASPEPSKGLLRASPEPWRGNRASPESCAGRQGFASLPYYLPNNLPNHQQAANHYKSANHYNHRSNSNFSSLPVTSGVCLCVFDILSSICIASVNLGISSQILPI